MEFDRIRLATSVVNRIMNIHDQIKTSRMPAPVVPSTAGNPNTPDPTIAGADIELRASQPATGSASPEGAAVAEAALTDGPQSMLDALLTSSAE